MLQGSKDLANTPTHHADQQAQRQEQNPHVVAADDTGMMTARRWTVADQGRIWRMIKDRRQYLIGIPR